jgi:tetratricopeptide (TPR) repeat protein
VNIRKLVISSSLVFLLFVSAVAQDQSAIKRGNELFRKEKYELAIKEYQRVSERNRDEYARALYNIGVCSYELWRTADAIAFYQRAVELRRGDYPMASFALGVALENEKRLSEAKEAYRLTIQASGGDHGPASYRMGVLSAQEGDVKSAASFFRKANTRPGPHVPASHNNLGVMLALMGKLNEAETEFATAFRLTDGKFDDAEHNLKLCRSARATAQVRSEVADLKLRLVFR